MSNTSSGRRRDAFSLVELLIALTLLGVAAAGLAAALTGDRRLRDLATVHAHAATRARERIDWLATRVCGMDTVVTSVEPWGTESWRATAENGAWHSTDSLELRHVRVPLVIEARVACPD